MMRALLTTLTLLTIIALSSSPTPQAAALSYPNGPITLVIPLAPGDATDIAGRAMADELAKLLKVGAVGTGSVGHLNVEMINLFTGAGLTMVPFKGGAPGITALLGGHVEGGAFSLGALSSHVKGGAVRGIVVSNTFPGFSEIPTLTQLGHRQNLLGVWLAFFAPAGVPVEVTKTLVAAIEKVAKDPLVAAKLVSFGILQDWTPPEKLVAKIREEHRTVEELAKKAGLVK